jgi:hypothetical protein
MLTPQKVLAGASKRKRGAPEDLFVIAKSCAIMELLGWTVAVLYIH